MSGVAFNGPYVIGYTLCFGLMGALSVQAYIYYTRFTDDRMAIKTLVTSILFLETLMTSFTFYAFWASATIDVTSTIDPITVGTGVSWSFTALAPITGLVTTLTHGFFCWRMVTLKVPRLIPLLIMMVSLLQLFSIIYLSITGNLSPSTTTYTPSTSSYHLSPWLVTWLGSSVVCDATITICMIFCLRPSRSQFYRSTLVRLIRLTVETGLVTTLAALLELVLWMVFLGTYYHLAVFYTISKLYANCLLASLNFRLVLRSVSDPSLSAFVWDSEVNDAQTRRFGTQSTHVLQILAPRETDIDMTIDLHNIVPTESSSIKDEAYETYEPRNRLTRV